MCATQDQQGTAICTLGSPLLMSTLYNCRRIPHTCLAPPRGLFRGGTFPHRHCSTAVEVQRTRGNWCWWCIAHNSGDTVRMLRRSYSYPATMCHTFQSDMANWGDNFHVPHAYRE